MKRNLSLIYIYLLGLILVLTVSCSRELTAGDDTPEQPFNFETIPVGSAQPRTSDNMPGSVAEGENGTIGSQAVDDNSSELLARGNIDEIYTAGRNALINGEYQKAINLLTRVVESQPDNTNALYNLSYAYRRIHDLSQAEVFALRAVESNPGQPYVYQNLGYVFLDQEKKDEAIEAFETELLNYPDDDSLAGIANILARLYMEKNLLQEAFDAATKAISLTPDEASYYVTLAEVHVKNRAFEPAITALQQAVEKDPSSTDYLLKLGNLLWNQGRENEAKIYYARAIELDPESADSILPGRMP